jgi:ribosomal protein S18 acetylase RimI-like enzyme
MTPIPDGFILRSFTLADYDDAFALWSATEGMGLGESDTQEAISSFLERNPGLSSVVHDSDGKLAGAVLCGHDGRRGYLHHLAVAKAHRGRGLGRALVAASLARLRAAGIPRTSIFLYASNLAGRAFWQHEGWRLREDIVIMQRESRGG